MDLGLNGKVAMVSGASRGLGLAVARALAEEGAHVAMASRSAAVKEAAANVGRSNFAAVMATRCDLRSPDDVEHWRDATLEEFGRIDLLFCNTGGPPPGRFEDVTDQQWQDGVDLLLLGPVRLVRAVVAPMRRAGGGSIVVSTSSSVRVPIANLAISNIVRASLAAMAKTLAEELAGDGIRVNQLVPGRIETERLQHLDEANARRNGITIEEQRARSLEQIPLRRYGQPEEFARAAAFLLSNASSYVTGATLQVDGGMIRCIS